MLNYDFIQIYKDWIINYRPNREEYREANKNVM